MAFAALFMLPASLWVDSPFEIMPTALAIAAVVALSVFSSAIAMIIYFRLVRTLGPLGVTTDSYTRAGFSVVLVVVLLGEVVSPSLIAGLVLIFAGVAIATGHLKLPNRQI